MQYLWVCIIVMHMDYSAESIFPKKQDTFDYILENIKHSADTWEMWTILCLSGGEYGWTHTDRS